MKSLAIALLAALALAGIVAVQAETERKPDLIWHDCKGAGSSANFAGYQSTAEMYSCKEGLLRIEGKWGLEIQSGWQYRTEFGNLVEGTEWVGDLPIKEQMPSFQKWCPTKYGFELCGWNEEEEIKQDALRKLRSHNIPKMKKDDSQ